MKYKLISLSRTHSINNIVLFINIIKQNLSFDFTLLATINNSPFGGGLCFDRFTPAELAFLEEYAKTMSPFAKALNVLQGETTVQVGKLQHIRIFSGFYGPLVDAFLAGIEKRFGQILVDPDIIAAAVLLPKFKMCCTSDECVLQLGKFCTVLALCFTTEDNRGNFCILNNFDNILSNSVSGQFTKNYFT